MQPRPVALVTGASGGIGRAVAVRLAADGHHVVLTGRDPDRLEATRDAVDVAGGQAAVVLADLADVAARAALVQQAAAVHDRLDVLVNNAGVLDLAAVAEVTDDRWARMIDISLTAPFVLCREAVPWLRRSPVAAIVNVTSTSGLTGGTSGAHYAAAKGGVVALTRALARELAPQGIRVNAVAPSKIDTDMLRRATGGGGYDELARRIPLGRVGTPDEVAAVIAFLASEDAGYVTGEVVTASGGYR